MRVEDERDWLRLRGRKAKSVDVAFKGRIGGVLENKRVTMNLYDRELRRVITPVPTQLNNAFGIDIRRYFHV